MTFERRQCIAAAEREGKPIGRIRAKEVGGFVLKVPRRFARQIQAPKALVPNAGDSEDWPHGMEKAPKGF